MVNHLFMTTDEFNSLQPVFLSQFQLKLLCKGGREDGEVDRASNVISVGKLYKARLDGALINLMFLPVAGVWN